MSGKWRDFFKTNVTGTQNVLEACRQFHVPYLVYTSTPSVVFDNRDILGGNETLPYSRHPMCFYQKSKIMAEKMVLEEKAVKTLALRPHLIFGEDDPHILPRLLLSARTSRLKIIGRGTNLVDVTYVENAAHAHILALEKIMTDPKVRGEAYFIGQEKPVNLWDFINHLLGINGLPPVEKKVPLWGAFWMGKMFEMLFRVLGKREDPPLTSFVALQMGQSHYFSHEKAKRDLGYFPLVSLFEATSRLKNPQSLTKLSTTFSSK
jgi:nucleoside-diphosphate-sugar epimerase